MCRHIVSVSEHKMVFSFCCTQAGLKAGLSASEVEELLHFATSQPVKDKLKNVTKQALDHKVSAFYFTFFNFLREDFSKSNVINNVFFIFYRLLVSR